MAIVKLSKKGYGQLELNQVAFRRDGRIEAQCKLDEVQFPEDGSAIGEVAENGMLFAIDQVNRTLKKATAALAATQVIGINYSAEKTYHTSKSGLKDFYANGSDFLPRLGYLAVGDKFHTNTVVMDDTKFADEEAIAEAIAGNTPLYAGIASDDSGYWEITATKPTAGPVALVVEASTMPDGQFGLQLQVLSV